MVLKKATEFELLEALEEGPRIRQVDLAARLRMAMGTVNLHLKRFAAKGYIKVKRIGRRQYISIHLFLLCLQGRDLPQRPSRREIDMGRLRIPSSPKMLFSQIER
jgi:DNA-binding IclR family transcriptional regulator